MNACTVIKSFRWQWLCMRLDSCKLSKESVTVFLWAILDFQMKWNVNMRYFTCCIVVSLQCPHLNLYNSVQLWPSSWFEKVTKQSLEPTCRMCLTPGKLVLIFIRTKLPALRHVRQGGSDKSSIETRPYRSATASI